MKNKLILFSIIIILSITFIYAEVPKITPYVNDYANILTPEQENSLNLFADAIEKDTTYEIAIVTVADTGGQARVEYANQIGDTNGVGKKGKDNGVVVLWSLDNEHGGAIATGRYSESIINDAKAGRIGRASLIYFDNQSYYEGFYFILNEISKELNPASINSTSTNPASATSTVSWMFLIVIIIVLLGIFFVIFPFLNSSNDDDYSSGGGSSSGGIFSGSSGGRSSSSGGGFSGGSFGGGGAGFGK